MTRLPLALSACALLSFGTVKEGEDFLKRAEERLYRWPRPGVVVRFEAATDVLAPMILSMKRDLARQPDAQASLLVDALEHLAIHGAIDTETGQVTTEVSIACSASDPRTVAALDEIRKRVSLTISGCFQGLPLHDPSLLHEGVRVTACEESDDSIRVTVAGARPGQTTRLTLGRASLLPEAVEAPDFSGRYRFTEAFPGRFAPSRLDLAPRGGAEKHAEYTYQKQGALLFPARVKVSSSSQSATITFQSLVVAARTP